MHIEWIGVDSWERKYGPCKLYTGDYVTVVVEATYGHPRYQEPAIRFNLFSIDVHLCTVPPM